MKYRKISSEMSKGGFTLLEMIVVIAIMAVLGTVVAPQFFRYVEQNRAKACQLDREGILAVYERCVYEEKKALIPEDLEKVMKCEDLATQNEVRQFKKCPLNGTYTATVANGVAMITCSCAGHEEAVVDFVAWDGVDLAEGLDKPFTPESTPDIPEPGDPSTEEPSTEEEDKSKDGSIWPYGDDDAWEGRRYPGQVVNMPVPTPVFTSRDGLDYVVVSHGSPFFPVHWNWNRGPEYIDEGDSSWEYAVRCSGIVIHDINTILHPTNQNMITGVNYGDILEYKGYRYIYASRDDWSTEKPFPIEGQNGNNFYLIATEEEYAARLAALEEQEG